ncbi:MAG: PRTRC system protein C [Variovorax paradoxus]|nr:MAG: PRTRC system protein C [Variovorax paradoxus]PZQ15171.1 MAG: PRTRC system protein C [Variovorax paradoxus]HVR51321.1 PRTRC system protein C [Pseudorhodoferax sp.]
MAIVTTEIRRVFRYNGIELPDVPGLSPREVRDLYSAQYPELISAEVEAGEVQAGVQQFSFRKAVGTKGAGEAPPAPGALAALLARVDAMASGRSGPGAALAQALTRRGVAERSAAWNRSALCTLDPQGARGERAHGAGAGLPSELLAPLP